MATNGTSITLEPRLDDEIYGMQMDGSQAAGQFDKPPARRPSLDNLLTEAAYLRSAAGGDSAEAAGDFALVPLVDKIAYGIARGLVVAMKELENHIATETRKVGNAVERQLGTLQSSLTDLSAFVKEQGSVNAAVQDRLQQLTAADACLLETDARQAAELENLRAEVRGVSSSVAEKIDNSIALLQESDARQSSDLEALRTETRAFSTSVSERIDATVAVLREADEKQSRDLEALRVETAASDRSLEERIDGLRREVGVQQEDVGAIKATLSSICSRIDAFVERLDRQADSVRLMHTTYSQRENELEQVIDGLARLRAFPKPLPADGL